MKVNPNKKIYKMGVCIPRNRTIDKVINSYLFKYNPITSFHSNRTSHLHLTKSKYHLVYL